VTRDTLQGRPVTGQAATLLAEVMATPDGRLDLVGFWRLFGVGGYCRLRFEATRGQWQGVVTDCPGTEARHAPVNCTFSTERVADFLRVADCRRDGPGQWAARYQEPA